MDIDNHLEICSIVSKALTYTPFDVKWLPYSPKIVLPGRSSLSKGIIQILELRNGKLNCYSELRNQNGFKCGTFGSSSFASLEIAVGDFQGNLIMYDLERGASSFEIKGAHKSIINSIDGIGGNISSRKGPPEIVTASKDGSVKLWDIRMTKHAMTIEQNNKNSVKECWAVSFCNGYDVNSRNVCVGYDNGDLKLYDVKMNKAIWETNLGYGIYTVEFDKKDSEMNKMTVTTLEPQLFLFDMKNFIQIQNKPYNSTIWGTKFLPQNPEVFASFGGNGIINLYKTEKDSLNKENITLLTEKEISSEPVIGYDWHQEKKGLASLISLNQTLQVIYVKLINL